MIDRLRRINYTIDAWLASPEHNAAGRLGIYRILYSLFYLWHLSTLYSVNLSGIPDKFTRRQVLLVDWLSPSELPFEFFLAFESILVAALVLLLFGYRTRLVTGAVILSGCVIEALFVTTDFEHSTIVLTFFIPFTMLVVGDWGATYSLDAEIRRRSGIPPIEPNSSSPRFVIPIHTTLAVVVALFVSSGIFKIVPGASWLTQPEFFGNLVLGKNISAALRGLPLNPLAVFIAQTPGVELIIRYLVVLFEILFFFALFHRRLLVFFLSLALVFHSLNAIWLVVTFTPILIFYGLFVDWEGLRRRLLPQSVHLFDRVSTLWLSWLVGLTAIAVAVAWNNGTVLRNAINFGGWINWHTVWYPVFPVAMMLLARSTIDLARVVIRKYKIGWYR